jgi:hypothetical protein
MSGLDLQAVIAIDDLDSRCGWGFDSSANGRTLKAEFLSCFNKGCFPWPGRHGTDKSVV